MFYTSNKIYKSIYLRGLLFMFINIKFIYVYIFFFFGSGTYDRDNLLHTNIIVVNCITPKVHRIEFFYKRTIRKFLIHLLKIVQIKSNSIYMIINNNPACFLKNTFLLFKTQSIAWINISVKLLLYSCKSTELE